MSTPPPLPVFLATGELADVPLDDEWLSAPERAVLAAFRLEKRRSEWRLGRWLARAAVHRALAGGERTAAGTIPADSAAAEAPLGAAAAPPHGLAGLCIIAAADGAPEVLGVSVPVSLSLSHSHGRGLAVAAPASEPIGCDVEFIEARSERFIRDWLTAPESERVLAAAEADRPLLANLCWSAKEAASKVLRVGLRFDTRAFDVALPDEAASRAAASENWQPIAVEALKAGERFQGLWRARAGFVETVLARTAFTLE